MTQERHWLLPDHRNKKDEYCPLQCIPARGFYTEGESMEGQERREQIVRLLNNRTAPVSGTELAKSFGVSRQVIVQDVALLRATNKNILSTNKGYVLYKPEQEISKAKRIFRVNHSADQMEDELNTMVDYGGKVLDVVVEHDIYGLITVDLILKSRGDVDEFIDRIRNSKSQPLSILTGGQHWHTVEADSESVLDKIQEKLSEKGYL